MPKHPANQTRRRSQKSAQPRLSSETSTGPKRAPTKLETIEKLLRRPKGASINELSRVTGWQAHSNRAVLTRLHRRDLAVARDGANETSRYRIVAQ